MPKNLVITQGHLLTPLEERFTNIHIKGHLIQGLHDHLPSESNAEILDAAGCFVTPGLFDLQVNGGPSCNFWDKPTLEEIGRFMTTLVEAGTTSFLPTLITAELAQLKSAIAFFKQQVGVNHNQANTNFDLNTAEHLRKKLATKNQVLHLARLPGLHLEGPCLSLARPGVHPPQYLQLLSKEILVALADDIVRLITLAPELDPTGECLEYLNKQGICVAIGHSNASLAEAKQAFARGVMLMTHTFNALPQIHHRNPGAVTAALLDDRVYCALICDGYHLDPAIVKLVMKTKGLAKVILVTDIAHIGTSQGGLVGSSIMLNQAVKNLVSWGVATFQEAIVMASLNPAKALQLDSCLGHLASGKHADLVLWDKETLDIKHVIVAGKICF